MVFILAVIGSFFRFFPFQHGSVRADDDNGYQYLAQQYAARHMKRLQLLLPRYLAALAVPVEMVDPAEQAERPERKEAAAF